MNIVKKYYLIAVLFSLIKVAINSGESTTTKSSTKEPTHNYLHENQVDHEIDLEDDVDDDDDEEASKIKKNLLRKKINAKNEITLKHLSNVFACTPKWDSLDDCDIIESFV